VLKAAYFDVTAIIELLRGDKGILAVVETYKEFYTGALAAAEIIGADEFLVGKKIVSSRKTRGLIESFKILPVTKEDAEKAGEMIGRVKSAGKHIGIDEAVAAAQCFRKGLILVTKNRAVNQIKSIVDIKLHKL